MNKRPKETEKPMKQIVTITLAFTCATVLTANVQAQGSMQSEEEFQKLMPITGTVKTYFGDFELDHSFPAVGEAEKVYDLIDHQRAAQLYLWALPLTGMTRWQQGYEQNYPDYQDNTLVSVTTFNERRGVLTANETTDYLFGSSNTRDAAVIVDIPAGTIVGMPVDMWQEVPADYGLFGINAGRGGVHIIVGPNTPADTIPEPADNQTIHHIGTDRVWHVFRVIGTPDEIKDMSGKIMIYNAGQKPANKIIDGGDKFVAQYTPRGLAFWELVHEAINREVVQERDRFFMYWLKGLGIEKGKPFKPSARQKKILEDGVKVGEMMAKTLVFDERLKGVLRQNNWRMILGGDWGDGIKYSQRMKFYDIFDPRARYTYEAITASPSMTVPVPGKAQAYIGKFEDEDGERLKGGDNYVIQINGPVPAEMFWSVVVYDTDTRCLIDNRKGAVGGKATVGSKTPDFRTNDDGSITMLLGPGAPPKGWEANYVQTLPGRGWFPYMRAYGAKAEFFNGEYKYPTVNKVKDFSKYIQ
jgi:hypothetical protein